MIFASKKHCDISSHMYPDLIYDECDNRNKKHCNRPIGERFYFWKLRVGGVIIGVSDRNPTGREILANFFNPNI